MKLTSLYLSALFALILVVTGCSKKNSDHDHAGHNHDHDHGKEHAHVHTAPHGGTLIEIGDHQFNLEFVLDSAAGKLTAYVLDAHAENFIRLEVPVLEINVTSPAPARTLILNATANTATGETVGNTSQFEASADWLKGVQNLSGTVARLDVRGTNFLKVRVTLASTTSGGK